MPRRGTAPPDDDPLAIDPPESGRIYRHRRRVHLADGSPEGRTRLDALARMLQDVSDEDTTDAGFPPAAPWVVRRIDMGIIGFPPFRDTVAATTWCSGVGGRWAERRVTLVGATGARVEAAVLWVHVGTDGRPARLPDRFDDVYGEAARGRRVRARLHHGPRPEDAATESFPLRYCDLDVMGHVNNAVSWEPVEEALSVRPALTVPLRVSVEHPAPIEFGARPAVTVVDVASRDDHAPVGFDLWITAAEGTTCSTAQVRPWSP